MARIAAKPTEKPLKYPPKRRFVARVLGPYPDHNKWRVIVISAEGCRHSTMLDSYEIAQAVKAKVAELLLAETEQPIGLAIDEFLVVKRKEGLQPASIDS